MNSNKSKNSSLTNLKGPKLKNLLELGVHGYFPLFEKSWLSETLCESDKPLHPESEEKFQQLLERLSQHRSIERQKIVLLSLPHEEKELFIKAFWKKVEGRYLDNDPTIH